MMLWIFFFIASSYSLPCSLPAIPELVIESCFARGHLVECVATCHGTPRDEQAVCNGNTNEWVYLPSCSTVPVPCAVPLHARIGECQQLHNDTVKCATTCPNGDTSHAICSKNTDGYVWTMPDCMNHCVGLPPVERDMEIVGCSLNKCTVLCVRSQTTVTSVCSEGVWTEPICHNHDAFSKLRRAFEVEQTDSDENQNGQCDLTCAAFPTTTPFKEVIANQDVRPQLLQEVSWDTICLDTEPRDGTPDRAFKILPPSFTCNELGDRQIQLGFGPDSATTFGELTQTFPSCSTHDVTVVDAPPSLNCHSITRTIDPADPGAATTVISPSDLLDSPAQPNPATGNEVTYNDCPANNDDSTTRFVTAAGLSETLTLDCSFTPSAPVTVQVSDTDGNVGSCTVSVFVELENAQQLICNSVITKATGTVLTVSDFVDPLPCSLTELNAADNNASPFFFVNNDDPNNIITTPIPVNEGLTCRIIPDGVQLVRLSTLNNQGVEISCDAEIVITDTEAPVVDDCPATPPIVNVVDTTVLFTSAGTDFDKTLPQFGDMAVTDDCQVTVSFSPVSVGCADLGTDVTVDITANDGANTVVRQCTVSVRDGTAPQCPAAATTLNFNAGETGPTPATVLDALGVPDDNCGTLSATVSAGTIAGTNPCPPTTSEITLDISDGQSTETCPPITLLFVDNTPPTFQCISISQAAVIGAPRTIEPTLLLSNVDDNCPVTTQIQRVSPNSPIGGSIDLTSGDNGKVVPVNLIINGQIVCTADINVQPSPPDNGITCVGPGNLNCPATAQLPVTSTSNVPLSLSNLGLADIANDAFAAANQIDASCGISSTSITATDSSGTAATAFSCNTLQTYTVTVTLGNSISTTTCSILVTVVPRDAPSLACSSAKANAATNWDALGRVNLNAQTLASLYANLPINAGSCPNLVPPTTTGAARTTSTVSGTFSVPANQQQLGDDALLGPCQIGADLTGNVVTLSYTVGGRALTCASGTSATIAITDVTPPTGAVSFVSLAHTEQTVELAGNSGLLLSGIGYSDNCGTTTRTVVSVSPATVVVSTLTAPPGSTTFDPFTVTITVLDAAGNPGTFIIQVQLTDVCGGTPGPCADYPVPQTGCQSVLCFLNRLNEGQCSAVFENTFFGQQCTDTTTSPAITGTCVPTNTIDFECQAPDDVPRAATSSSSPFTITFKVGAIPTGLDETTTPSLTTAVAALIATIFAESDLIVNPSFITPTLIAGNQFSFTVAIPPSQAAALFKLMRNPLPSNLVESNTAPAAGSFPAAECQCLSVANAGVNNVICYGNNICGCISGYTASYGGDSGVQLQTCTGKPCTTAPTSPRNGGQATGEFGCTTGGPHGSLCPLTCFSNFPQATSNGARCQLGSYVNVPTCVKRTCAFADLPTAFTNGDGYETCTTTGGNAAAGHVCSVTCGANRVKQANVECNGSTGAWGVQSPATGVADVCAAAATVSSTCFIEATSRMESESFTPPGGGAAVNVIRGCTNLAVGATCTPVCTATPLAVAGAGSCSSPATCSVQQACDSFGSLCGQRAICSVPTSQDRIRCTCTAGILTNDFSSADRRSFDILPTQVDTIATECNSLPPQCPSLPCGTSPGVVCTEGDLATPFTCGCTVEGAFYDAETSRCVVRHSLDPRISEFYCDKDKIRFQNARSTVACYLRLKSGSGADTLIPQTAFDAAVTSNIPGLAVIQPKSIGRQYDIRRIELNAAPAGVGTNGILVTVAVTYNDGRNVPVPGSPFPISVLAETACGVAATAESLCTLGASLRQLDVGFRCVCIVGGDAACVSGECQPPSTCGTDDSAGRMIVPPAGNNCPAPASKAVVAFHPTKFEIQQGPLIFKPSANILGDSSFSCSAAAQGCSLVFYEDFNINSASSGVNSALIEFNLPITVVGDGIIVQASIKSSLILATADASIRMNRATVGAEASLVVPSADDSGNTLTINGRLIRQGSTITTSNSGTSTMDIGAEGALQSGVPTTASNIVFQVGTSASVVFSNQITLTNTAAVLSSPTSTLEFLTSSDQIFDSSRMTCSGTGTTVLRDTNLQITGDYGCGVDIGALDNARVTLDIGCGTLAGLTIRQRVTIIVDASCSRTINGGTRIPQGTIFVIQNVDFNTPSNNNGLNWGSNTVTFTDVGTGGIIIEVPNQPANLATLLTANTDTLNIPLLNGNVGLANDAQGNPIPVTFRFGDGSILPAGISATATVTNGAVILQLQQPSASVATVTNTPPSVTPTTPPVAPATIIGTGSPTAVAGIPAVTPATPATGATAANEDDGSNPIAFIIPIGVVFLLICIAGAILLFWFLYRNKMRDQGTDHWDRYDGMNKRTDEIIYQPSTYDLSPVDYPRLPVTPVDSQADPFDHL